MKHRIPESDLVHALARIVDNIAPENDDPPSTDAVAAANRLVTSLGLWAERGTHQYVTFPGYSLKEFHDYDAVFVHASAISAIDPDVARRLNDRAAFSFLERRDEGDV